MYSFRWLALTCFFQLNDTEIPVRGADWNAAVSDAVQSKQFSFLALSQWRTRYPPYRGIHPCSCAVNHRYLFHCPCYRKWAVNSTFHKWADNCLSAGARSLTMPYPPISWKPSRSPRPVQATAGKRNQNDLPCIWPKQGYAWYLCEWVQGKDIVIPYVGVKKGVKSLRKELRDKLIQHRPTTEDIRSPPMSQLKLKTRYANFLSFVYSPWYCFGVIYYRIAVFSIVTFFFMKHNLYRRMQIKCSSLFLILCCSFLISG